ncbi:MAG: MFS transporter [Paracoccaceae bacterium]
MPTARPPIASSAAPSTALVALLAALTAIGPFSLQVLAPALPAIATDLSVSASAAQLVLSSSLVAMALATLVWGPLSDRFGRRPVMIAAMALAVLGSVLGALAPGLGLAVAGRALQAGGAIAGMVVARAIAQDVWGREGAAGAIGQITAAMVVAPMLAPVVSGTLVEASGWRAIFWLTAGLAALLVLLAAVRLHETAPAPARAATRLSATLVDTGHAFAELGRDRAFWAHAGYGIASLSAFLFFVGAAPFVMEEAFGIGARGYGLWFVGVAGAYMASNLACGRVTARLGSERALRLGAGIALLGIVLGLSLALSGVAHPAAVIAPVMVQSIGAGLSVPNALAGATAAVPGRAGAASGLMGSAQFATAGLATQVAGALPHGDAVALMGGMGAMLAAGLALNLGLGRRAHPVSAE